MKWITAIALVVLIGTVPVCTTAQEPIAGGPPLMLVFSNPVGEEQNPSDSDVIVAVVDNMKSSGQVDVLVFNPDLPVIVRAIMERRLDQQIIRQASDPKKAAQIAAAVGAQYSLGIRGSVENGKVSINLDMVKVIGGQYWAFVAESEIAQGTGVADTVTRRNAVLTASSSAVSQAVIAAFGPAAALNPTPSVQPQPAPTETPAAPTKPAEARDVVAEYNKIMKQVDAYLARKDTSNAILELRKAINLEPDQPGPRVRLAEIYLGMGLVAEAVDECKRALLFRSDSESARAMLARIFDEGGAVEEALDQYLEIARLDPENVEVRLKLGDLYWNQGKIDDAERMYIEASEAAPSNPMPHERLQRLHSARKQYGPSLEHMLQAKILAQGSDVDDASRYQALASVIRNEFDSVMGKLDSARADFARDNITREAYYRECKEATNRIDALAGFLSTRTAPGEFASAHGHGVLAVSLLAQSAGYTVSYLETEKQHYSQEASLLQTEAKTEMALFTKELKES